MADTDGAGAGAKAHAERGLSLPADRRRLARLAATGLLVGLVAALFLVAVDQAIGFWLGPQLKVLNLLESVLTRVQQCGAAASSI